jgi:hypothetical protein
MMKIILNKDRMIPYIANLFNLIGSDGMKHIILSAILTVVAKWLLPVWVAVGVVLAIAKEIYDKVIGNGCAEWTDLLADFVVVIIWIL